MKMTAVKGSPYAAYAFEVLYAKLNKIKPFISLDAFKQYFGAASGSVEKYPLFVTWNTLVDPNDPDEKELRGCIGTFAAMNIEQGLREYSIVAALEDSRFDPVTKSELKSLSCGVTLLKDFEKADDIWDWEVGLHGIRISFEYLHRQRGATFLPDVAVEQGWDKETTLRYLIAKGGGPRGVKDFDSLNISLTRYKGEKSSLTYKEFISIRNKIQSSL